MKAAMVVVSCLVLGACAKPGWQSQALTPEQLTADRNQENLRLTLRSGTIMMAHFPSLLGDTLTWVGRPDGKVAAPGDSMVRFAVPVTDLQSVQRWQRQSAAPFLIALGILTLLAIGATYKPLG